MSAVNELSEQIVDFKHEGRIIVGVNGVDGSGKTEFVKNLAAALKEKTKRQIVAISIDGFHNPRSVRYAKGRESHIGYYEDSFNMVSFIENVLKPLKNNQNTYITKIFDYRTDTPIDTEPTAVKKDAIILVEGIFLFKPLLAQYFDIKIFLDVPFEVTFERMQERDVDAFESRSEAQHFFEKRYKPGQQLYFSEVHPKEVADIVIDNSDYMDPKIKKI